MILKSPFPFFGGKSQVADIVWQLLGQPKHYLEPFFGSGAVLFRRPEWNDSMIETVNDKDCHLSNVWRAIQWAPEETAKWCDWPVNHADLCARRNVLIFRQPELAEKVMSDPEYFDAKLAGWWIWAASCWIGSGLTDAARKKAPTLTCKTGVQVRIPRLGRYAFGIQRPQLTKKNGVHKPTARGQALVKWFSALSRRLRQVSVVCGEWHRICGGNWQDDLGPCGIFFDPPYGKKAKRKSGLYAHDSLYVADDVREWCRERAQRESYRIVLAGYYEEHESLLSEGWGAYRWETSGGYGNLGNKQGRENKKREALFYSPHCLKLNENFQGKLWEDI